MSNQGKELKRLAGIRQKRAALDRERDKLDGAMIAAIQGAQAAGVSVAGIARELGVTRQAVYDAIERAGT